jgi:NHLM bacteriocin system ABC transporter ATP-binding protein
MLDERRDDAESVEAPAGAADLEALFAGVGRSVDAGARNPFLLAGDGVWLVRQGQVDIFSVRSEHGRPVGPRTHLVRVEAGGALFGLEVAPLDVARRLLAVGVNGTEIVAASAAPVCDRATNAGLCALLDRLTEGWVEALCVGMARDVLMPKKCVELEAGAEVTIRPMTSARPAPRVCWIKHLEGSSLLLGCEGLEVNGHDFTPLSRRTWLQVREPARAILLRTGALPAPMDRWRGLARLHELTLRHTEIIEAQTEVSEAERMRRRAAARITGLSQTCARLAATMQPHRASFERATHEMAADTVDEALLASCRLVGEALTVPVRGPVTQQGAPVPRDPLAAILRASRLRARKVALRDEWWRVDAGPLLASVAEDQRPVALLPSPDGYRLHDPMRRTVTKVTAAEAATLVPFAHAFYRPFPDIAIGVKELLRFGVRGSSSDWTILLLMGVGGALLAMVPSIATGMLFNSIIPGAQRTQLVQVTTVLVACAVATALCNLQRGIAFLRIQGRMGNEIQSAVWDRLLSVPLSFFRPFTAGNLAVRAGAIDNIRQLVSGATVTALMGGIFSLGNFCLMFYYSSTMAWWATATILVAVLVTGAGSYLQLGYQRAVLATQAKTSGLVLQLLTSVGKLRVAGADVPAFGLWGKGFGDQRALQFKARTIANWVSAFNAAFPVIAYLVIFWAAQPAPGQRSSLGTGDFLAFLSAFASCLAAVLSTSMAFLATLNAIPLYEQAAPILRTLPEVDGDKAEPGVLSGDIEIQHAVFRYRSDGPLVLRDVTLHINAGEFVAFVGPSGSGKSTMLRLLLGFDQLESGSIYYDGQELGGLDIQAVRRQIGVVLQSGRLMSGDILTNIIGSGSATLEEGWDAARMAGLADDIKQMPMGMHTVISEGGGTLSGGQRQRLLIARAIVNRPRILLFDEATSALDNRTQAIVSASLERLQATRIVVAHRLSTIVNADRICVIERGRIVETGKHHDLMARNGLYTELARRQLA